MSSTLFKREAISRARFFLGLARELGLDDRDRFEAFLEASIIFGRAALHRFKTKYEKQSGWKQWWDSLKGEPSVEFFRTNRDHILKEGSARVHQTAYIGTNAAPPEAERYYYFEAPSIPATDTVERHLDALEQILHQGKSKFSTTP